MTDRGADLFSRGRRSGKSSQEAWDDIKNRNTTTDWDPDAAIVEREHRLETAADGEHVESAIRYVGNHESEQTPY